MTKKYIIYEEESTSYYQYNGKFWQRKDPVEIMEEVLVFSTALKINSVDGQLVIGDKDYIKRLRHAFTIRKLPFVTGHNIKDGFLTKEGNDKYILYDHSPIWWQNRLIEFTSEEIFSAKPSSIVLRFIMDCASEGIISINLLWIIFHYSLTRGKQQIIVNLAGTQRGGKSSFMDILERFFRWGFRSANLAKIDNFQRNDLLPGSTVISFPDTSPKRLKTSEKDFLRAASGRDKLAAEKKHGEQKNVRPDALMIIINNESFEDVAAYKSDPALSSRVLNIVFPSINKHATVPALIEFLEEGLPWLVLLGITTPPELIEKTQRATVANELTGSGIEKPLTQFVILNCAYKKGSRTKAQDLKESFQEYLTANNIKLEVGSNAGFYKQLDEALESLQPEEVDWEHTRTGMTYFNIFLTSGKKRTKLPEGAKRFTYTEDKKVEELFSQNPFKIEKISFCEKNGKITQGPWLNPTVNEETWKILKEVKDKNIAVLVGKEYQGGPHFKDPKTVGGKKISQLNSKDFFESENITFQIELEKRPAPNTPMQETVELEDDWMIASFYKEKPFITTDFFDPENARELFDSSGFIGFAKRDYEYGVKFFKDVDPENEKRLIETEKKTIGAEFKRYEPPLIGPAEEAEQERGDNDPKQLGEWLRRYEEEEFEEPPVEEGNKEEEIKRENERKTKGEKEKTEKKKETLESTKEVERTEEEEEEEENFDLVREIEEE